MSRNVEVKIKVPQSLDLKSLIVSLQAQDHGEIHQIDTYFGGGKRLKLREYQTERAAELIAYDRPDIDGLRTCDYRICNISNAAELKETLGLALTILKCIEKTRHLYLLQRTRIHLDDVKGLGHFLELEVVLAPDDVVS